MKITRKPVGTGITKHERITWTAESIREIWQAHDAQEAFAVENGGYIDPKVDFSAWLDWREQKIAEALDWYKLPAPNRAVAYDETNPRDWRYIDRATIPGKMHNRTEWYLQDAFPYQSSFWYLGRILFEIHMCRDALKRQDMTGLAGHALELGSFGREMDLKFSGQNKLRDFERYDARRVAHTDKGNAIKREVAAAWKACARRLAERNPDTDWDNISQTARDVLSAWPSGIKAPRDRTLRAFLGELAKRHVSPEM